MLLWLGINLGHTRMWAGLKSPALGSIVFLLRSTQPPLIIKEFNYPITPIYDTITHILFTLTHLETI